MDAMTRAALKTISQELGLFSTIKVGMKIAFMGATADPFKRFDTPADEKEARSRDQLKPAVLLYRVLLNQSPQAEALRVTRQVVQASGRAFLKGVLGDLDLHALVASEDREERLRARLASIPNANFSLRFEEETLHFTVSACRFVGLCHQLGHPELAPLFCSVDDAFFGHDLKGVSLERETTIAEGGHHCPFVFTLNDERETEHDK